MPSTSNGYEFHLTANKFDRDIFHAARWHSLFGIRTGNALLNVNAIDLKAFGIVNLFWYENTLNAPAPGKPTELTQSMCVRAGWIGRNVMIIMNNKHHANVVFVPLLNQFIVFWMHSERKRDMYVCICEHIVHIAFISQGRLCKLSFYSRVCAAEWMNEWIGMFCTHFFLSLSISPPLFLHCVLSSYTKYEKQRMFQV